MKTRLAETKKNITSLETLCASLVIPEGVSNSITVTVDIYPQIVFHCPSELTPEATSNRDRLLDLVGRWFGKDGWTRELAYYKDSFTWKKSIGEVRIEISHAEMVALPPNRPVDPRDFPILLEDKTDEELDPNLRASYLAELDADRRRDEGEI